MYVHSVVPSAVPASLVTELLPQAADYGFEFKGSLSSLGGASSTGCCCNLLRKGVLQYVGLEVPAPQGPVQQQLLSLQQPAAYLRFSSGFEKYWLSALQLQVVDDDIIRGSTVYLKEGSLPLRFSLDARAERGRQENL